ncbi:MAG: glycoside hydrolase family protein [Muribaculaceae bacterium]|nr:glycoside hydrolase family protein [Muribaculaceae bacterium]MCM1511425.1 glycoside hydrolase family protein [Clostridium sp.]
MAKKSIKTIAQEVIDGKWGNGVYRKEQLAKAGYDYAKVQEEVNKLLSKETSTLDRMDISSVGLELIKQYEGFCAKACKALPTEKYLTIGYGHYGADVKSGQTITKTEALKLLKKDVQGFVAKVNKYQNKYHWNQNQFDALVSFAYNVGNIDGLTANGTRSNAVISDKWVAYSNSGGKFIQGLYNRRVKERTLFNKK